MLNISALSLFAYNLLISQLGSSVQCAMNGKRAGVQSINQSVRLPIYTARDDTASYWTYLPFLGNSYASHASEYPEEFSDSMLTVNKWVNALLIFPAFLQVS